jgi:putative ABC transport system permease protein
MIRATVKGLMGRKLRTALTALAIVLGVAMVAAAYITTDTMLKASDELKSASYGSADAVVSGKTAFKLSEDAVGGTQRKALPESLIEEIAAVPQVQYASAEISGEAKITDKSGKVDKTQNAPPFAVGFDPDSPGARELSPFEVRSGAFPTTPNEIAIDVKTAKDKNYAIGDSVGVVAEGPVKKYEITGIVSFGGVDSIGSASASVFSLAGAQELFNKQGQVDSILVKGETGVPAADVRAAVEQVLPPTAAVQTAQAQDRFDLEGLDQFLDILRTALLVFGFISLFVGAFIIFNTLSITVAQRTKEFGLLRMIGASRRQVLRSVILEAIVIGLVASIIGIAAGFGLSKGINALFTATGVDLPSAGTVFAARTVIVAMLVGVVVTTLAGLGPALRATRIAPVAALREGSVDPARKRGKVGWAVTILALVGGIGLVVYGVTGNHDASTVLSSMGGGSLLLFIGVALIAPTIAKPMAAGIGQVTARLGGSAGRLARDNAMRNPHRTATTAAALMIGIALVTFVAVLGAGLRDSFTGSLKDTIQSNYVVTAPDGWTPFSPGAADKLAADDRVQTSTIREDQVLAFGDKEPIDSVDENAGTLLKFDWQDGSNASFGELGPNDAIVSDKFAEKHGLEVGSPIPATTPSGEKLKLTVSAISDPPEFNPLGLGDIMVAERTFEGVFPEAKLRYVFVEGDVAESELSSTVAQFPDAKVWTIAAYADDQGKQFDQFLNMLYVLLALSVIVSLFGIVNTLVLSVFERTRELGMLRAVGMTRRQTRRMIRHESVITSVIGAVLGIAIGVFLSALVVKALEDEGVSFSLPAGTLVAFMVVAIVAGVLAAILPARRAARLNVLNALQYE